MAVPGSNSKMLAKAAGLPADEVFLDLEDSVAPSAKEDARETVANAIREHDWGAKTVVVRINAVASPWAADDLSEVVAHAGGRLDCVMVPKVEHAHEVMFVDHLLRMLEAKHALGRRVGIEAQIETATGLENVRDIARASGRLEALIFGPADMSASLGVPTLSAGLPMADYPGDHWHWALETILVAARAAGVQAIDGPYLLIEDSDGLREMSLRAQALGYDGKWALHPSQIALLNEVFTPPADIFAKACAVLDAYRHATEVEGRGAVMFGNEMIDEASRKMATQLVQRGLAAGMVPPAPVESLSAGDRRADL